ncbi:MAG: prolipoprotein diacylglyceryl transferase [Deltaproteobacteria bacterium]|nr:prolipoprotein diacylglyceryl transferase [Deltaproteobacteria bacterium]
MYPLLFEIPLFGGIRIYTYGVLVALGFLGGIAWTVREAKRAGVDSDRILDLCFYIVLSALVGSRILYVIVDWQRYLSNPLEVLKIWEGGLVFYGGLIGAILMSLYYLRKHKMSFLKVADLFVPGIALGHAIGRLACFAAGCCYGRPVALGSFFSVIFPHRPYSLAPAGIPLFPSQLFESVAEFLIFLFLVFLGRRKKQNVEGATRAPMIDGQLFSVYLMLYGVSRMVLEVFRGDSIRGYLIPQVLTTSQFISGILVVIGVVLYRRGRSV